MVFNDEHGPRRDRGLTGRGLPLGGSLLLQWFSGNDGFVGHGRRGPHYRNRGCGAPRSLAVVGRTMPPLVSGRTP